MDSGASMSHSSNTSVTYITRSHIPNNDPKYSEFRHEVDQRRRDRRPRPYHVPWYLKIIKTITTRSVWIYILTQDLSYLLRSTGTHRYGNNLTSSGSALRRRIPSSCFYHHTARHPSRFHPYYLVTAFIHNALPENFLDRTIRLSNKSLRCFPNPMTYPSSNKACGDYLMLGSTLALPMTLQTSMSDGSHS